MTDTGGIVIDGSRGEGGGQILRTSLTLSLVTGRPIRLTRIRESRGKPGLAAQHLAAVRAAAQISKGRGAGAELGSTELVFEPGEVRAGEYRIEIGTAGSTSLVLQTIALPLGLAHGPSRVAIVGGTHVPWSPTWDFMDSDWCPLMEEIGLRSQVRLLRSGYYPRGDGEILALISGGGRVRPLNRKHRGNLRTIVGTVYYTSLPRTLAERIIKEARLGLRRAGVAVRVESEDRPGASPGTGLHLAAQMEGDRRVGFTALSSRGKLAEKVAREAVNAVFEWLDSGAALSPHLADQALLPLSLAEEPSVFTTSRITSHLVTNAEVIQQFQVARIRVSGKMNGPGEVTVTPSLSRP